MMDTPRRWPWRLLLSALLAPAHTLLVRVPLRGHVCPLSQCGVRMTAEPEEPGQKRRGILWPRIRNKVSELDEHATIGESVEVITDEVDAVLAARRKRLDRKLKTSLKRFRTEVTNEADLQAKEAKERQARLKERQSLILTSLADLREDILDEIEATVSGFKRGGKALEQSVRGLRSEWEREVNVLIDGARQDVDMAVGDIEEVIKEQREEWQRSVDLFESTWLSPYGGRKKSNATDLEGKPVFFAQREEVDSRFPEIQRIIDEISGEIEEELSFFKQRWKLSAEKLEGLPNELKNFGSLAELRMYVADGFDVADRPKTKRKKGLALTPPLERGDPLGLRITDERSRAVLRPTAASNLRTAGRKLNIFTTASLPWMTGTSVNPLLRAAHLAKAGYNNTLYLPWLVDVTQQDLLFPKGLRFRTPKQQEQYVRWWLENRANIQVGSELKIRWFDAEYKQELGCIIQRGDVIACVPPSERDVAILEEPEHLNWYHHGPRWTDTFSHVVGVLHTNYLQYCIFNDAGWSSGQIKRGFTELMNNVVIAAHTDIIVRLSATLPEVPGYDLVCNVHGVRAEFLAVGAAALQPRKGQQERFPQGAYFLGKALWSKGYRELLDSLRLHAAEELPEVHTYGSGPESDQIIAAARGLPVHVNDGIDHAHPSLHGYRVFVNPSTSDVLCTATAEALAMGKKVVIPEHPSNVFFKQFTNCVTYEAEENMVPTLQRALASEPVPLSPMEQYMLSWEAATERLLDAAALPEGSERSNQQPSNALLYWLHYAMGIQPVFDVFRSLTGAEPEIPWSDSNFVSAQPARRQGGVGAYGLRGAPTTLARTTRVVARKVSRARVVRQLGDEREEEGGGPAEEHF
jgi:digalactosyldiacylglycerol synthase